MSYTITTKQLLPAIMDLRRFINAPQIEVLGGCIRGEEGEYFRAKILALAELTRTMPKTYEQDGKGAEAVAYLHYFSSSADWYITERDQEEVQHQAFGLADLYGDGGELGYISIVELIRLGVEIDLYWTPKTLAAIREKKEGVAA